ncbi:MAG: AAA family ATPase, partial [Deltaproteobacteria bacterium]|nr:AAA family ATPase [Deltaproteobacteria bacterium]
MQELPLEGQSFTIIRNDNLIYVDKTKYLYSISKKKGCYFLSRPRRFGKSLLLGSLNELLQGKRELFKGLWIDSSDYDFPKMPVVMLSMTGSFDSKAVLEQSIKIKLKSAAKIIGIDLEGLISFKDSSPADILR